MMDIREFYLVSLAYPPEPRQGRNIPCCPRGKRSEYRLLIESAVLPLRENCGVDFSVLVVDDIEFDRATSGSGNA